MKLITEVTEDIHYITEAVGNGVKNHFIEGIIMQGDIKNRNGRIYPSPILMKEMSRYNTNYVNKNRAFGELGHPQGPTINLDRVSHMFTELKQEGSNVVGKAKIMDTPMGKTVKSLIEGGAQLGISSRGMGTVKQNPQGIMEVQNDFLLATAGDIVADPSAPNAFVKGIMEDQNWIYDIVAGSWRAENVADEIVEEIKVIKEKIKQIDPKILEEQKLKLFRRFMKSI